MATNSDGPLHEQPDTSPPDSLETLAVWAGEERSLLDRATQVPVVHSVSFGYRNLDEWLQVALGKRPGHIYSRNTNPTVDVFEHKIGRLEGAPAATSAATGMGVISSTLFAILKPGDRVTLSGPYGDFFVKKTEREMCFIGGGAGIPFRRVDEKPVEAVQPQLGQTLGIAGADPVQFGEGRLVESGDGRR